MNTVLITHLSEVIKGHAHELMGRQEVREMVNMVKETHPAVVDELIPDLMSIGELQKILQNLLRENIPCRIYRRFWKPWLILPLQQRIQIF